MTMMIEELQVVSNPVNLLDFYVIGRMIHLDTDSLLNTDFDKAIMNHIDLAVNLYTSEKASIRLNQWLPEVGQVVSTDERTHLIKFMPLPFRYLPKLVKSFFKSDFLVQELTISQFG